MTGTGSEKVLPNVLCLKWRLRWHITEMFGLIGKLRKTSQSGSEKNGRREARLADLRDRCVPAVIRALKENHGVEPDARTLEDLANCGVKL
ncbi:MAG: hypothetical protein WC768_00605 [Patescibacteria group bacterium]|jgi:hypothetical protein